MFWLSPQRNNFSSGISHRNAGENGHTSGSSWLAKKRTNIKQYLPRGSDWTPIRDQSLWTMTCTGANKLNLQPLRLHEIPKIYNDTLTSHSAQCNCMPLLWYRCANNARKEHTFHNGTYTMHQNNHSSEPQSTKCCSLPTAELVN